MTAVVVNYRSGEHLGRCLDTLLADSGPLSRVIVVDNASGDGSHLSALEAATHDSRVTVRMADHNLGLAGGVNLVLSEVETPYLAVLNPDVTVRPGWLDPLIEVMESSPTMGVACPVVMRAGTQFINSAGQTIHVTGFGFNRLLNRRPSDLADHPIEVSGLHGATFLIRTDLLRGFGGWDETGFLYHEDVALSWDVLLAGSSIVCVPEALVDHDYHLTMYPEKLYLLERNRWSLLLSHLRWGRLALLFPLLVPAEVMVWGLCLVRGRGFLGAKARSYRWLVGNADRIRAWRSRVMSRAVYDTGRLNAATRWGVPIDQLLGIGGERGQSTRVPPGGLPT